MDDRPPHKKVVATIGGVDVLSTKDYVPHMTTTWDGRLIIHDRVITDEEVRRGWVEADDTLAHEIRSTPPPDA